MDAVELVGVACGVAVVAAMFSLAGSAPTTNVRAEPLSSTPALEAFLKEVDAPQLLAPLQDWGARTVDDLKYLSEDDLMELGVSENLSFRKIAGLST
eukprot:CAMPEP_0118889126 /NCGR_PEP_ID=MMETSP1166-20130328/204_1 /TAXON_ID=1104430 /ORGANISM="Chrysoreinhardia sp, Strain CCMP3193" /LENGTH=96 /DNA_ID=CAMNT_0006827713 /DNA_START=183 /DNA_END=473 /DNA_ORIENTATION=-